MFLKPALRLLLPASRRRSPLRRLGLAACVAGLLAVSAAPVLALPAADSRAVLVNADILNVRSKPEGEKVGKVYRGQQFILLHQSGDWGKIIFNRGVAGWVHLDFLSPVGVANVEGAKDPKNGASEARGQASKAIPTLCRSLNREFDSLRWGDIRCDSAEWQAEMRTPQGNPLLYTVLGENRPSTSLLVCSVHSDENTSYQCFKLLSLLKSRPKLLRQRLVVVPLANPDGFLTKVKTRTNFAGVDLNRNLPTADWIRIAHEAWKVKFKSDPRRNPGASANSELENQFLVDLINRFEPDKVISIHAPLNFLDLDFQELHKSNDDRVHIYRNAKELAQEFSQASNFRFHDYNTFPGSLGRYGNEWRIPIYTLELPTSDASKSVQNFVRFRDSMVNAFNVILDERKVAAADNGGEDIPDRLN